MNDIDVKKVLILGIDALEFDLVEEWNLTNLKQIEYGKVQLPINSEDGYFYSNPNTLIMWTSFITGHPPKYHGIDAFKIYKFPFNIIIKHIFYKIFKIGKKSYTPHREKKQNKDIRDNLSYIAKKLNIYRDPKKSDIKVNTMFENTGFFHKHIPVYDDNAFPPYKKKIIDAIENKSIRSIFEFQCKQEFSLRTKEVINFIDKKNDWKLFMQYFFVLDGVQHTFYNNLKKIAEYYIMFDEFIGKIKKKIDSDTLLFIISDHGQKKGIHTDYAFYSSNKILRLKNPKLTNFKQLFENLILK